MAAASASTPGKNILICRIKKLKKIFFRIDLHMSFIPEVNANDITMVKILDGEYCGLCHGAVSFPLSECNRCHAAKRLDELRKENPGADGDIV